MSSDFKELQRAFTANIRQPDLPARNRIAPERLAVYQSLTFYNFAEILSGAMPILRSILSEPEWENCVRNFIIKYRATTPLFYEIPQEFVTYISQDTTYPRWWFELAHYEWIDLALDFAEDNLETIPVDRHKNIAEHCPLISPLAWLLHYHYPVHLISAETIPNADKESDYYYIAFRNRALEVHFLPITIFTARLFELLTKNTTHPGKALVEQIIRESQHPQPEIVLQGGLATLQDFLERDIILGCKN